MGNVKVIAPDGRETYVLPGDLKKALSQGYKEPDFDLLETGRAFGEAVLRVPTLGLSDEFFAGAAGAPYRDSFGNLRSGGELIPEGLDPGALDQSGQLKKRREEHPVASFAGSAAGALLPTGALGRAKSVGQAVAGGMLEGGLFGLGSTVTEDALGDKEALSQKLLANVGIGSLTGGGIGAAGFGIGKALNAAGTRLMSTELPAELQGFKDMASKVLKAPYKQALKDTPDLKWADIERIAKEEGIFTARSTPESIVDMADMVSKKYGAKIVGAAEGAGAGSSRSTRVGRPAGVEDASLRMKVASFLSAHTKAAAGDQIPDAVKAGVMGGVFGGPVVGANAAVASLIGSELRSRAPYLTAAALEKMGPGVMRLANGLKTRVEKLLTEAPALLGPYQSILSNALANGVPELLRTHVELASSANGDDYMTRLVLENEDPAAAQGFARKVAALDTLEVQGLSVKKRLEAFASRAVGAQPGPAPTEKFTPDSRPWEQRVKELQRLSKDPSVVLERLPADISSFAPGTSVALASKVASTAQYLLSKAPQNPYLHLPEPMRPKWIPPANELEAFDRAYRAVEDPLGELERARTSVPRVETLEAIAKVYPQILQEAREAIFARLATRKVSYAERLRLAPILGPDMNKADLTEGAFIQSLHDKAKAPVASPKPDGRQTPSTTKNLETQAVRLEARGLK